MKKIITLSIVCLVSGQIFAQNAASTKSTTDQKVKQDAATSGLSLVDAQNKNVQAAQATPATPVISGVKLQKVEPAKTVASVKSAKINTVQPAQATAISPIAPEVGIQKVLPDGSKAETATDAKANDATKAAPVKKEE